MNVKQLKKLLKDAPDDATVLIPGSDHSYYEGHASVETVAVIRNKRGYPTHWAEYYNDESMSEGEEKAVALVVGAG